MDFGTPDLAFIIAGWGVILGGTALYAALLIRRLRSARDQSLEIRRSAERAEPAPASDPPS